MDPVLRAMLIIGAVTLVLALIRPLARRGATAGDGERMVYPALHRWIGPFCAGFFGFAIVAFTVIWPNGTATPAALAVVAAFMALGIWSTCETWLVEVRITPDGLEWSTLRGRRRGLRWEEVRRVGYSHLRRAWLLETPARKLRVPAALTSQPAFAASVLSRVSRDAIDEAVRRLLEATEAGDPPPSL